MRLPRALHDLAESLARLPSIGPRQAIRLALHIAGMPPERRTRLAGELANLAEVSRCVECGFPFEGTGERCEICANPARSPKTVMAVEKETDVISMEKVGRYRGRYLVTGPLPRAGSVSDAQRAQFQRRAEAAKEQGGLDELILALSGTASGDALAATIESVFSGVAARVTRLGRGLPRGAEIEFADEDTLGYSLESRK